MTKKQGLEQLDASFKQIQVAFQNARAIYLQENYKASSKYCMAVIAGHGGVDESTGQYTTAPDKMFLHEGEDMHKDGYFYEGVSNRIIADKFCKLLKQHNIVYKKFYHQHDDWSLKKRTDMINYHHANVQPVICFDIHSNASMQHNARGFSVYTSPNQTKSDKIATKLWQEMDKHKDKFGYSMRSERWVDNDVDYEAKFWTLVQTASPSVLPEFLFFDNLQDARILMLPSFQDVCAEALLNTAIWADANV